MTDILEQWRSAKERWIISGEANEMIVGLETEIERLREALRPFAERAGAYDPPNNDDDEPAWWHTNKPTIGDLRKARAALGEGKE